MTASEYTDDGTAGDGATGDRRPAPAERSDDEAPWHRRRWTTIVLEEYGGGWRATQTGVAAEGHGDTAADAAAAYCRRIAETGDRRDRADADGADADGDGSAAEADATKGDATEGDATERDATGGDAPGRDPSGRDASSNGRGGRDG
jgi:hypothetical protein